LVAGDAPPCRACTQHPASPGQPLTHARPRRPAAGTLLGLQQQYLQLQQQLLLQQQAAGALVEDEYVVGEQGGYGKDTDAVRRLKAQGRFAPY
jgi:hypothetical protein